MAASSSSTTSDEAYRYLVVDSGPIIRLTGLSTLWKGAKELYTVPAVLQEIRDAKAREHLESLPFDLITRDASPEGIHAVIEFARKTGDYQSLSAVDIQVLGLLYDLEREGVGNMDHVRTTPKRTLGVGKIQSLGDGKQCDKDTNGRTQEHKEDEHDSSSEEEDDSDDESYESDVAGKHTEEAPALSVEEVNAKSWAKVVDPIASSQEQAFTQPRLIETTLAERVADVPFGKMKLVSENEDELGGQFSDAEEEPSDVIDSLVPAKVRPADPDPVLPQSIDAETPWEDDLKTDFPTLASSLHVPYEGEDEQNSDASVEDRDEERLEEERKQMSLRPISKSGKLYNSFGKYSDLFKPKSIAKKDTSTTSDGPTTTRNQQGATDESSSLPGDANESRIIGATGLSGQGDDVEDDGEGWITSSSDIRSLKAVGGLDPTRNPSRFNGNVATQQSSGPPVHVRAACATTDFAMQNVILQMNLELLSVDGVKVRKLKSWVTRCGACYKVYTSADGAGPVDTKRMFCERCGSDMMQRIAASVDGKTGRLRLHLSKRHKNNLRGTKFSLPKPGSGNRFQGDLLLREDQLLMGAWNQKVKMRSGGKSRSSAESMFGKDIASNVGCHAKLVDSDDIRVGFGRRNPNAVKGRERRGKKKKSPNKACGLHRY